MSANKASASLSSQRLVPSNANPRGSVGNRHNYRSSRSALLGASMSRRAVNGEDKYHKPAKANVQVIDEHGVDVTPRSLLDSSQLNLKRNQSLAQAGVTEASSISAMMGQSIQDTSTMQMSYAQGFSRSITGSVMGSMSRLSFDSLTDESVVDQHLLPRPDAVAHIPIQQDVSRGHFSSDVTLHLSETDTIWHLDLVGTATSKESDDGVAVTERNRKYEQLLQNRIGNDMYVHGEMQTFNDATKTRGTQASLVQTQATGCMATTWDMYDAFAMMKEAADATSEAIGTKTLDSNAVAKKTANFAKESRPMSAVTSSRASSMTISDAETSLSEAESTASNEDAQITKLLQSEDMMASLFTMERAIMQNIFHVKQATYRGCYNLTSQEEDAQEASGIDLGPTLERLWVYSCPLTKGKPANCLAWNKVNKDILAVGYGVFGTMASDTGLVCCWSLKNPEFPERCLSVSSPVTSIDFSTVRPNLIAVGLYDGTIIVYDICQTASISSIDTRESHGKHCGPVWQLEWVRKGAEEENDEILVSASADGRVTQWAIRKGLEHNDLMKLKRLSSSQQQQQQNKGSASKSEKKSDALISRYSSGMAVSFHPVDSNVYIVGTEDGHIHKCSCSYNEQFLETYSGHTGAVYNVKWSPFVHDVFLSCSSDWTARLWHQDRQKMVFLLRSTAKRSAVLDFDWSPASSTVFASIDQRHVEVWDLNINTLDPIVIFTPIHDHPLTSMSFARSAPALFVGDSEGNVTAYLIRHFESSLSNKAEVLEKVMTPSQLQQTATDVETDWKEDSGDSAER